MADRIAVLRRGKLVQVTRASETSPDRLAQAVMGSISPASPTTTSMATPAATSTKAPLLVARDLRCDSDRGRPALRGLSFHIAPGEILGVAGVEGNGQSELAEVLTGLRRAQGSLLLADHDGLVAGGWARSAAGARAHGIVHLPEDRHRRALCLPLTMEEHFALGRQREPPYARGGLIDTGELVQALEHGSIGGAALDVTDPEPLPDGHLLWSFSNVIITPHIANTWDMALPELAARVERNVLAFGGGTPLEGQVDIALRY